MTNIFTFGDISFTGSDCFPGLESFHVKAADYLPILRQCLAKAKSEHANRWHVPVLERAVSDAIAGKGFMSGNVEDCIKLFLRPDYELVKKDHFVPEPIA